MIDVLEEDLIDLRGAAKARAFKRNGKSAHFSAVYRWATYGARAANGERIRLETVRTPSGLKTSCQAIQRFIAALTDPDAPVVTSTLKLREKQMAQAEAELREAGMLSD